MSDFAEFADWTLRKSAFVPALVAFSLGSRHSLRAYLAAQQVGSAPEETDEQKRRGSLRRKLALAALIVLIGGGETYLICTENERVLAMCMRYMLAVFYQTILTGTFADLTHAYKTAVYRTPMSLVFAPVRSSISKSRLLVTVAIATGLNVATYLDLHYAATMALSTAVIYRLISRTPSRTFSLRVFMIILLAWLALTALISGVLIMYLVNYWMDGAAGDGTVATGSEQGPRADGSLILTGYIGIYQTAILALAPGILIAACYRFDYANHVEANPELAQVAQLETVSPSSKCRRAISDGVVLPQSDPVGFARPYFTTALWSWMLGMMASFGILSMVMPLSAEALAAHTLDLVGLTLAIPFMVVGLVLTASIRREFKRMWTYKEVWFTKAEDKTEGAIALPTDDADEETLPAYEIDSDREALDEKVPLVPVEATLA